MSQDIRIIHLAATPSAVTIGQGPAGPVGPIDETVAANLAGEVAARASGDEALAISIANEASLRAAADTTAAAAATSALYSHTGRTDNPHTVTKTQVGLANVPNTDATQRANHSGTQTLSTISDAGTAAALNAGTSAGNVPVLDGTAKLPVSTIPAIAITDYLGAVSTQSAMLALTGQKGDWCTRTDEGKTYLITGPDPSVIGGWTSLSYAAAPVTSVAGKTGEVTLAISDVTSLQSTLNAKQPLDADLTAIAALGGSGLIRRSGGGGWDQVSSSLGGRGALDDGALVAYDALGAFTASSYVSATDPNTGVRVTIASTGNGSLSIHNNAYNGTLGAPALSGNVSWDLPNTSGTLALASDIISSSGGNGSSDSGRLAEYDADGTLTSSFGITLSDPNVGFRLRFTPGDDNLTDNRVILIPDGNGTMALVADFDSYLGSTSINTVGTISDGASYWQANPIGTPYGGTGMDNGALPANRFLYTTTTGVFGAATITSAGRALIDDADAAAQRTTLGLSSLATTTPASGVATFLSSPTSANLRSALTDETGTGAAVFADSPTIGTPNFSRSSAGLVFTAQDNNGSSVNLTTDGGGRAFFNVNGQSGATSNAGAYCTATGYQEAWFNVVATANTTGKRYMRFGNLGDRFSIQLLNNTGSNITSTPFSIANEAPSNSLYMSASGGIAIGTSTDPGGTNLLVVGTTSTSGLTTTTLSATGQVELTGQAATNGTSAMTRLLSGQLSGSSLPLLGYTIPNAFFTYNGSNQTTHVITIRPSGYVDNTITASSARTRGSYGEILASGTGADFLINGASSLTNPETAVIVFRCTADSTTNGIVRYRSFNVLRGSGNAYVSFTGSAATVTSSSIAASTSTICVAAFSGDGSVSRYHLKAGANKVSGSWNDTSNAGDSASAGYIQANAGHGGIANGVEFIGGFLFAGKASASQLEALAEHYHGLFA